MSHPVLTLVPLTWLPWAGVGQLVALELISISGVKSHPEPGELTDLTAQHFIRFEPINLWSKSRKQLIIRNAT